MSPFYTEFNATFWLSMGTLIFGFGGVIINGMFKSKCKKCKICCIEVERDTQAEIEEQKLENEHARPPHEMA